MLIKINIIWIALAILLTSCTYLKHSSLQAEYTHIQNADPSQLNLKHMIDREKFFVIGKTIDKINKYSDTSMAIVAYSNKFKQNERVDIMFFNETGTHYGLSLPEGIYTFLVYADINKDQVLDQNEIVGKKNVVINITHSTEKIISHMDINLREASLTSWAQTIHLPEPIQTKQSLFYPSGTIRSFNDPIFNEKIATLGMYDPASFLEHSKTMFYALDEDFAHKIPVIFVHGIGGSSRSFEPIIKRVDRDLYKVWLFYYPSGGDLDQLASLFYSLFLSGKVIPLGKMPMLVIAHSMGGLVVREALNKYQVNTQENKVKLFVTIASPLGGHPSAALGEKHSLLVLPAWRDLNPDNRFIKELYKKPLPKFVNHQLFYAYQNTNSLKFGENSDGVVPLSSQLCPKAQKQSRQQFGFNDSHVGVLRNDEMITLLLKKMNGVKKYFSKITPCYT
jgi:pimeloyl-ACP methyl ester carboxylesterase